MKCSDDCFILSLIYLDRIANSKSKDYISSFTIHKLFLTGTVIAAKFIDDKFYKNSYYAEVGGVSNLEMNSLEMAFLQEIDFELFVEKELYDLYVKTLGRHMK